MLYHSSDEQRVERETPEPSTLDLLRVRYEVRVRISVNHAVVLMNQVLSYAEVAS